MINDLWQLAGIAGVAFACLVIAGYQHRVNRLEREVDRLRAEIELWRVAYGALKRFLGSTDE